MDPASIPPASCGPDSRGSIRPGSPCSGPADRFQPCHAQLRQRRFPAAYLTLWPTGGNGLNCSGTNGGLGWFRDWLEQFVRGWGSREPPGLVGGSTLFQTLPQDNRLGQRKGTIWVRGKANQERRAARSGIAPPNQVLAAPACSPASFACITWSHHRPAMWSMLRARPSERKPHFWATFKLATLELWMLA